MPDLELESTQDLIDELVSREAFRGIIVCDAQGSSNLAAVQGKMLVEVSSGLANSELPRMLDEVQKVLTQVGGFRCS